MFTHHFFKGNNFYNCLFPFQENVDVPKWGQLFKKKKKKNFTKPMSIFIDFLSTYESKEVTPTLSIGTPNTTTFPFVPNGKWWLLGVPIFEHIIIRL